jgi:hypothetical protein
LISPSLLLAKHHSVPRGLPPAALITTGLVGCVLLVQACSAQPPSAGPGSTGLPPGPPVGASRLESDHLAPGGPILDLAPRQQWNANFGYCGEISFIVAGLFFGQYLSQYEARAVASGSANQSDGDSQLLLGVNDGAFAARSHLEISRWSGGTVAEFLAWIRGHVLENHPVIIGLYANQRRFYGRLDPLAGSPEYDHIVSVLGVLPRGQTGAAVGPGGPDWELLFSDHGLLDADLAGNSRYRFQVPFSSFARTRTQANQAQAPFYSLPEGTPIYGVAVLGVKDQRRDTLPVRLSPSSSSETPEIANGSTLRPAARPLELTITVTRLRPGLPYRLYRYDSLAAIPEGDFNAHAGAAARQWNLSIPSGTSVSLKDTIRSDAVAAYRAVPLSAP